MAGHPLQFQLTLYGQLKVFRFQALAAEVRDMWTTEIKRLLEEQFALIKGLCQ